MVLSLSLSLSLSFDSNLEIYCFFTEMSIKQ